MNLRIVLMILILFQNPDGGTRPAHQESQAARLDQNVRVDQDLTGPPLQAIMLITSSNQIPVGIVLNDTRKVLCPAPITLRHGPRTVGAFVHEMAQYLPDYQVDLKNGVMLITPLASSNEVREFLDLSIPEFNAVAMTHRGVGGTLWLYIHQILVPSGGTLFHESGSIQSEQIGTIRTTGGTVESNLNFIATRGHGAAWILYSSKILKSLPSIKEPPFKIYDYVGEAPSAESAVVSLPCVE